MPTGKASLNVGTFRQEAGKLEVLVGNTNFDLRSRIPSHLKHNQHALFNCEELNRGDYLANFVTTDLTQYSYLDGIEIDKILFVGLWHPYLQDVLLASGSPRPSELNKVYPLGFFKSLLCMGDLGDPLHKIYYGRKFNTYGKRSEFKYFIENSIEYNRNNKWYLHFLVVPPSIREMNQIKGICDNLHMTLVYPEPIIKDYEARLLISQKVDPRTI